MSDDFFDTSEYLKEHGNYKERYAQYASAVFSSSSISHPDSDWDDDVGNAIRAAAEALIKEANEQIQSVISDATKVDWDFKRLDKIDKALDESGF